ncbi:helix-turn-helix domain-containing protein [Haloechinothrix sp. YIM 98757]|uniref:Helix-turn-helix domain-containing protein n=1 Tax=Haloechinothrix aidingensis TaxID=2752311 RepID=A0A838ABU7_9PSEU|nr:helix-turn-helix transcriptional regulator [Haloechinothrix aidingensis]MBA0126707.1 helix-turn-helix domain-containing protein [Haloechinothrix aidingensis]
MKTATRAKRRLGRFLNESRVQAGVRLEDAATELKTADSTVSRYESGQVMPVWATVLALLNLYGVTDEGRSRAVELWENARDEPPSIRLPTGAPKSFRRLVNAEREAERIRIIERSVVPGLMQSESYARSLIAAGHRLHGADAEAMDKFVAARLARQRLLEESGPVELHAVIDEAVIRRVVGGPAIMCEQLAHLLDIGAKPHVTIQVMPFRAGAYGTMNGSNIIVDYPEPDEVPGVYLEYPAGGSWVDNASDVERFTTMFDDAARAALSPADSAALLTRQIGAMDTDDQQHEVA